MFVKIIGSVFFLMPVAAIGALASLVPGEAPTVRYTVPNKIEVSALEPAASIFQAPPEVAVTKLPRAPVTAVAQLQSPTDKISFAFPTEYLSGKFEPVLRPVSRPLWIGSGQTAVERALRPRMRPW